jgi:nitrogen regulatory protein P-II 1
MKHAGEYSGYRHAAPIREAISRVAQTLVARCAGTTVSPKRHLRNLDMPARGLDAHFMLFMRQFPLMDEPKSATEGLQSPIARKGSTMRLVIAIIRPYHVEALQQALNRQAIDITTVSEVLSGSADPGYTLIYRDRQIITRRPKCRVEFLVEERQTASAAEIVRSATTAGCPGNVSDAKIMILQLEEPGAERRDAGQTRINGNGKHVCAN